MEFKQLDIFIKCSFFFLPKKKQKNRQTKKYIQTKKAHVGLGGKEKSVVNFTPKI